MGGGEDLGEFEIETKSQNQFATSIIHRQGKAGVLLGWDTNKKVKIIQKMHPTISVQHQVFFIQPQIHSIQHQFFFIQPQIYSIQHQVFSIQSFNHPIQQLDHSIQPHLSALNKVPEGFLTVKALVLYILILTHRIKRVCDNSFFLKKCFDFIKKNETKIFLALYFHTPSKAGGY
ncbi:MAG: hypothetical protein PVH88_27955 [Ignavibacteria bacterium]